MDETKMDKYKRDLLMISSITIQQITCPYDPLDSWELSMRNVYSTFKQKIKQRQRIMTMVYTYYVGELINLSNTPREKWLEFVQLRQIRGEYHYYLGITRIYKLFKSNVNQIYQTSHLSYRILLDMKSHDYRELVRYHLSFSELTFDEL